MGPGSLDSLGGSIFDQYVLTFDKARIILTKRPHQMLCTTNEALRRNPTTGIAGCCARPRVAMQPCFQVTRWTRAASFDDLVRVQ